MAIIKTMKRTLGLWTGAAGVCLSRVAQAADGYEAPQLEGKTDWPTIGILVLAIVAVAAAAFKNAHRTHLD